MAKIWPVYEGREPTRGKPWFVLPLKEVIRLIALAPQDFVSNLDSPPRFGDGNKDLWYLGYKHIIVEVDEAPEPGFKQGFYRASLPPSEAFDRLLEPAIIWALGKENVVRVEHEEATDFNGRATQRVKVVLSPGASLRIGGDRSLTAFGRLYDTIPLLSLEGTPQIEYGTEEEFAEDPV